MMDTLGRIVAKKLANNRPRLEIYLEGVGDILLERSQRAKHVCLSVRPFKGLRIAVPHGVSYEAAMDVAREKIDWITKQLQHMRAVEQAAAKYSGPAFINRAVARNVLVDRLATLAERHGFRYNKVFVRNQKTRWGSCSMQNNINLNVHLICLPDSLRDYVILHELVHTRHKNHGHVFWQALEELLPGAKEMDGELNRYEVMLLQRPEDAISCVASGSR